MIDEKGIRQERWKSWEMVRGGELENERQVKRGVLKLGVKNTWLTTPLVTQPVSHTRRREWMCSHSSEVGSAAEGNTERLMNIVFKYSKTFMQLSLFSFTLKCPLVTSIVPPQFRWKHMEFLLERRVLFPAARYISWGCWELNLSRKWKLCKWKCCLWQLKLSACAI